MGGDSSCIRIILRPRGKKSGSRDGDVIGGVFSHELALARSNRPITRLFKIEESRKKQQNFCENSKIKTRLPKKKGRKTIRQKGTNNNMKSKASQHTDTEVDNCGDRSDWTDKDYLYEEEFYRFQVLLIIISDTDHFATQIFRIFFKRK